MLLRLREEARVGTRLMLSRKVANCLMIEVWGQGWQLAGLARVPASSLHWDLAAGRADSMVMAAAKLTEVVEAPASTTGGGGAPAGGAVGWHTGAL